MLNDIFFEWGREIVIAMVTFTIPLYVAITMYFKNQHKKDTDYIKGIIENHLNDKLRPLEQKHREIQEEIREIKKNREVDLKDFNLEMRKIFTQFK